jgi:ribosomal protein S18 acetylase RimI-like enzyme
VTVELVPELLAIDGRFFQRVLDCETIGALTGVFSKELTENHFNRVLTLSGDERLSGRTVRDVIERFDARGRVPCVYLNLSGVDPKLIDLLLDFGFRRHDETLSIMYAEEWSRVSPGPDEAIVVGRAGRRDRKAWAGVLAEANGMERDTLPALERFYDRALESGAQMYMARDGARPVGTGTLVLGEDVAGIYNVGTAESGRHRGVASALIEAMLRGARSEGLPATLQAVTGSNAERLYKRFGFRTVSYTGVFTREI